MTMRELVYNFLSQPDETSSTQSWNWFIRFPNYYRKSQASSELCAPQFF